MNLLQAQTPGFQNSPRTMETIRPITVSYRFPSPPTPLRMRRQHKFCTHYSLLRWRSRANHCNCNAFCYRLHYSAFNLRFNYGTTERTTNYGDNRDTKRRSTEERNENCCTSHLFVKLHFNVILCCV